MDKNAFQPFRRSQIAELRPFVPGEETEDAWSRVSISAPDRDNGSPKLGDMIARNPANHDDVWLVAKDYFAANFEPLASGDGSEETSSRVASIAGRIMNMTPEETNDPDLLTAAKTLAASALTQAPDREPGNFVDRLKLEREDLDDRLGKLAIYLGNGAPGASSRQRVMLEEQSKLMSDLLAVLDERLTDLQIEQRSTPAPEISDGE